MRSFCVLVAEGQPARLLGLIDPTSAFFEAAQETGAFVVHVLAVGDRALAERFSEVRPPIRGPFERLEVAESPWGPVLGGSRPRAACPRGQPACPFGQAHSGASVGAGGPPSAYPPTPLPGPVVDAYGCGDAFAAGLTFALAAGLPPARAVQLAARCGAAALTGRGPYSGQLTAASLAAAPA